MLAGLWLLDRGCWFVSGNQGGSVLEQMGL